MVAIRIPVFGGVRPAVETRNGQSHQALTAHNTVLRDTALRAMRDDLMVDPAFTKGTIPSPIENPTALDLYKFHSGECCNNTPALFECESSVLEAPGPGSCGTFETAVVFPCGCGDPYRIDVCTGECCDLVVPAPTLPLVATINTPGTGPEKYNGPESRIYTYTWVDKFGVESPPAPPSEVVCLQPDGVVDLSNFTMPPDNAVCRRIYRLAGVFDDKEGQGNLDINAASFQLVEEVGVGSTYTDTGGLCDMQYGTLLTHMDCPPPCMDQVILTESGYAVGFKCNTIYMSERHDLHNWPEKYRVEVPERIVSIAQFYDTVFVGTTGRPYRISIQPSQSGNEVEGTILPVPYMENYPQVGRRTMVATNFGAMYNSTKGMVALGPTGPAQLITRDRVDEDRWERWRPTEGAWVDGKYVGLRHGTGQAWVMDIQDGAEGAMDIGDLVTMDLDADRLHMGRCGSLWFLKDGEVFRWMGGNTYKEYCWKSKVYRLPGRAPMLVAKVNADFGPPVEMKVYADGRLYDTLTVCDDEPFRLCPNGKALEWTIELKGTTPIYGVHLASSISELAEEAV